MEIQLLSEHDPYLKSNQNISRKHLPLMAKLKFIAFVMAFTGCLQVEVTHIFKKVMINIHFSPVEL